MLNVVLRNIGQKIVGVIGIAIVGVVPIWFVHEWRNDTTAVSAVDSVKLEWSLRYDLHPIPQTIEQTE